MSTNEIFQILQRASKELTSDEMIILNEGYENPDNKPDSENDPDAIFNVKQTFGFKITNAKHIGYLRPTQKPILIETNLSSILQNKSFYQTEKGKVCYHKVSFSESLTLKQIRDITIKLLIAQYDVFNGYSPYQSFFNCLYLFEDFHSHLEDDIKKDYDDPRYLKVYLFQTGLKLFLLTFFKIQCIANAIYNPNDVFSNEWSSFDFIKEESIFDKEFLIHKSDIKTLIECEFQKIEQQDLSNKNSNKKTKDFNDFLNDIKKDIKKLTDLQNKRNLKGNIKNPLSNIKAKETIDIILYESQIAEYFIKDQNNNKISVNLPDSINDFDQNPPGFCYSLNYPDTGIRLNSDISSYDDLKNKYTKMIQDILYIDSFISNLQRPSKIDELTNIFIDWNSTNTDSITIVRFYFFRKFIPFYTSEKWEINIFRPNGPDSNPMLFKHFIFDIFDKTKELPPDHIQKMVLLFGKFFTYCLRLLIFRPYKLQKSLLKTVIIQWVRNIWQIYKFDKNNKKGPKVFSKKMKDIFFSILHTNFKYYICYSFLTDILEMGNTTDMLFLYSFLFINLVLSPFYNKKDIIINSFLINDDCKIDINGERMIDLYIYKICFDLLLYQYLHDKKSSKEKLLKSFYQNFFVIQKNVKKYYSLEVSTEFNIDDIYERYADYINKFYDIRKDKVKFKIKIEFEIEKLRNCNTNLKIQKTKQNFINEFIKMITKDTVSIEGFFKNPLEYTCKFKNSAYPYLCIEKINTS